MSNQAKRTGARGDTIVEVLLSITIIGFVLGAAYLLTNRSLQAGIAAREHTEAVNYVQGQIERLKSAKESSTVTDFNNTYHVTAAAGKYCLIIDASTKVVTKKLTTDIGKPCDVDSDHPDGGGRYHLSTIYTDSDPNAKTFKFSATWERVGTGTTESVDIYYRTVTQ
ncbi:type II secretion system protein [Candidatus Saccharibacteria bacterium]|nr:type II secretion system protein [Candidatus Saccharibacteria bacterium]